MNNNKSAHGASILLVDDNPVNLQVLGAILRNDGYNSVHATSSPADVLALFTKHDFDLIILDIHMPGLSGFEVMAQLNKHFPERFLPIIILTSDDDETTRDQALANGARDFMCKPFDHREVVLRARNLIETVFLHKALRNQNQELDQRVRERTDQLYHSQVKLIQCLGKAAEFRDNETGMHVIRISKTTAIIARALGLPAKQVELIEHASPMHDIGKIAIPDRILLKAGKLEGQDWITMKSHVQLGATILQDSQKDSELLRMASDIALTHHERWDGNGYPAGLKGEEIPLYTRITTICDVFDALTSRRPYKPAWPNHKAMEHLKRQSGTAFDPNVVACFEQNLDQIIAVKKAYPDPPEEEATCQIALQISTDDAFS